MRKGCRFTVLSAASCLCAAALMGLSPAWSQDTTRDRRATAAPRGPSTRTPAPRSGATPTRNGRQPRLVTRPNPSRSRSATTPVVPEGFRLSAADQKRVDQILRYWEHHTTSIKTFQCTFTRENFDFVFGRRDTPKSVDVGTIRYSAPDKGLMRVDKVYDVQVADDGDQKPKFVQKKDLPFGEYWVCDGQAIFQFDARSKVMTETQLPPELRGKAIGEGPLPFLFGAKAETMKARYWIREITPSDNPQGEYYLEAVPKRREDAANFEKLQVQLAVAGKKLFPKAMKVFTKQGFIRYSFKKHKPNDARHRVADFLASFVAPKVPRGWTYVVEDWDGNRIEPRSAARK